MYPRVGSGLIGLLLPLGIGAAGGQSQDHRSALLAADRAAAEMSRDSGIAAALRRDLSPSSVLLWPGAPVLIGDAEIRRFTEILPARDSLHITWQPLGVFLDRDSVVGVTWGVAVSSAGSDSLWIGRYIFAWQLRGGRWNLDAVLLTHLPPAPSIPASRSLAVTHPAARGTAATSAYIEADLAFARTAGDSGAGVAFRTWAAPDAVIFGGSGVLIRGPKEIGAAVAGPERWRWHPVAAGGAPNGDLGWTAGEATITGKDDTRFSKYLTIWSRSRGKELRFLVDGGNSRPQKRP